MSLFRRSLPACPRCGSRDTMRIVLARPRPDLPRREGRRWPILPGLGADNPNRVCKRCGHQWRSRPSRGVGPIPF